MCVFLIWLQMYLILEFGEKYIFSFIFYYDLIYEM